VTAGGTTVLVVGAGSPGKRRVYERLVELGARLVIADEPGHWSTSLAQEAIADRCLAAPVTGDPDVDAQAILAAVEAAGARPTGVFTIWEDSVTVAARVAAALGLPGNPPQAVDAARSKLRTRETAARLGLPSPRAHRVRSLDELYAAAADIGFPAVVKPEFGALAMGCVRVDDVESLPNVYRFVRDIVRPEIDGIFRAGNDLLLEQYLDGPEFDVDVVLEAGRCLFYSVSQELPVPEPVFQAQGMFLPPSHSRRAVGGLVDLSVRMALAFGFVTGVLGIRYDVHDVVAAGDLVALRATGHGVHNSDHLGFPATRKPYAMQSMHLYRAVGDRLAEHWGVRDELGALHQVGAIPPPPAPALDHTRATDRATGHPR